MDDEELLYTPVPFPKFESSFLDSEFSYPSSEVEQQFFDGASQSGDVYSSVIYESDVGDNLITELESEKVSFGNVVEIGGKTYVLQIRIFVSRDESYLARVFERTSPNRNEVCLFLEDNSTDLLSPRSYYIKIGDIFRSYLESHSDDLAIQEVMRDATEYVTDGPDGVTASFSQEEIQTLIREGSLSVNSVVLPFLNVFKTVHSWSAWVNDGIGDTILKASEGVKYYLKFADTSWDPEARREDGSDFHPILVPGIAISSQDKVQTAFKTAIREYARSVIGKLDSLAELDFSFIPGGMGDFIAIFQKMVARLKEVAQEFADALIRNLTMMMDFFQGLGNRMLNVINAYYCGLWNSLIDALMGIPDILGYMFKLSALPSKLAQNIDVLAPKIIELMDEAMQMVHTTNWTELISTIITETGKGLMSMLSSSTGYLSWERVAYFIGAVGGFIIENAIGFLLSAGVINIASITSKLGKFGKFIDVIVGLITGVNKAVDAASEAVFKGIIRVVGWLFSIIRKGASEARTLIRSLFAQLKVVTKVADNLAEGLLNLFGMTADHLRRLQSAGFEVIEIADGGASGIIKKTC
ncbi:hypothetical protein [Muriicola sp. Z0-33]|uniref:phage tail protein n=1 Tax=Muriicola sp. Z0-33 TaxID=2816957 RepID=UPI0022385839|nr:hypothetical protein [Muriicola sp. Z0-33]MCW5517469.1 hypothetical protein [Muriicola sp. Z0-33]